MTHEPAVQFVRNDADIHHSPPTACCADRPGCCEDKAACCCAAPADPGGTVKAGELSSVCACSA